jgi:hypothetical protein
VSIVTDKYPQAIDMTGQVFGRLTVLSVSHSVAVRGLAWHCQCSCGKATVVRARELRLGMTRSCGCLKSSPRPRVGTKLSTSLHAGQRFGHLVISGLPVKKQRFRYFPCDCDCGGKTLVRGTLLVIGQTRSCGCLAHRPQLAAA